MRQIIRLTSILLASIFLVFISCIGPQGEIGFVGPPGPEGAAGQDGIDGQEGVAGVDGNANVTSITYDITDQSNQTFIAIQVPQLTEKVLSEDLILVYLRYAPNQPYEWILASGFGYNPDHILITKLIIGEVLIEVNATDVASNGTYSGDYDRVKVIIAKASTVETGKTSIDFEDYSETMEFFDLSY